MRPNDSGGGLPSTVPHAAEASTSERTARLTWTAIVLGLLGLALGSQGVLVAFALNDPSAVPEPDYYRKGLDWDEVRAQRAVNRELGWRLAVGVAPASVLERELTVEVLDAQGAPLAGAGVSLEAFHKARRAQVVRAQLAETEDGAYRARLPLRRPGLWELRFVVQRGELRFTHTAVLELEALR